MAVAEQFISEGYPVYQILPFCGLSRSSYYYHPKSGKRGRKPSKTTISKSGISYSNDYVLERIKWLLEQEFVDYGYEKVTAWLVEQENLIINQKKVYRLMKEAKLLNTRIRRDKQGKVIAKELLPNPTEPFESLQRY